MRIEPKRLAKINADLKRTISACNAVGLTRREAIETILDCLSQRHGLGPVNRRSEVLEAMLTGGAGPETQDPLTS